MPARFHLSADPARDCIRIELSGFFALSDVRAFTAAWRHAHTQLRCPANHHVTLCDLSKMDIQSQDVVAAFAAVVRDPSRESRRLAMLVGVSLSRHQAKRLAPPEREGVAFFYDREAAEEWLFSDDRTAARCPHVPISPTLAARGYTVRNAE